MKGYANGIWTRRGRRRVIAALSAVVAACASFVMPARAIQRAAGTARASAERTGDAKTPPPLLPLKPERTIEFTTDEGTWLSLDVSPDRKTILFELLGHLYTLPFGGGEAKAITSGPGFDSQPRYSHDGSKIVFVSDRGGQDNLWIAGADGSHPRALTTEKLSMFTSPAWSSDDNYVIVSRKTPYYYGSSFELWLYDIRGGSGLQLTKGAADPDAPPTSFQNALGVTISPDDRYLYYAQAAGQFSSDVVFPLWQIARFDRTTGDRAVITQEPGSAIRPLVSPDGTQLVYGTRFDRQSGLRLHDIKSGQTRWLKYPIDRDDQESYISSRDLLPGFAFTPDGKELVVAYGGKIHRLELSTGRDEIVPFTAKVTWNAGPSLNFPTRVESGPMVRARIVQGATSSPDGGRIAFTAFAHLYSTAVPGGKPQRVTTGEDWEFDPAWSPDGKWLAYVTWTDRGGDLWKVPVDGAGTGIATGPPVRLTRVSQYYSNPVWSPDGSRIVLLRMPWQDRARLTSDDVESASLPNREIIDVPAAGGDVHVIASSGSAQRLHFSREPDRVYFTEAEKCCSIPGKGSELISIRLDGMDRKVHLRIKGKNVWGREATANTQVLLNPDGKSAAVLFRYQAYLVRVPPAIGSVPATIDLSSPGVAVSRLTDIGADYVGWAKRGADVTWVLGATFSRVAASQVSFDANAKPRNSDAETIPVVVERERVQPRGEVVLRGARVISMRGDEVIERADVVISGSRITALGAQGSVTVPPSATVLDVAGKTIVPGFVDTHAHWSMRHGVLDKSNWDFWSSLAFGVTSGRDPQTQTTDIFAYQDLEDVGEIVAPRLFSTGPGIFWTTDFTSVDDAVNMVGKYKTFYRTHTIKSYLIGDRRQRQWMVEACKRLEMMPTTEGAADMRLDLTHFIDGFSGNEHNLPLVPLYKDIVELVARSKSYYNPAPLMTYGGPVGTNYFLQTRDPYHDAKVRRFYPVEYLERTTRRAKSWTRDDEYDFQQVAAAAAKIVHAGGKVSVGSHGNFRGLGYQWALWAFASGGLTPREALRMATLDGAESIGYGQDLGSIEPGKLADLLVLEKNPLEDIHNAQTIRYVMKNGTLFDGETLDEVWPSKTTLPKRALGMERPGQP